MSDYPKAEDKAEKRREQLKAMLAQAKALSEARDRIAELEQMVKDSCKIANRYMDRGHELEQQLADEKIAHSFTAEKLGGEIKINAEQCKLLDDCDETLKYLVKYLLKKGLPKKQYDQVYKLYAKLRDRKNG